MIAIFGRQVRRFYDATGPDRRPANGRAPRAAWLAASARRAEALRLLDRVHLPRPAEVFARCPHQLSGGRCQRVLLADIGLPPEIAARYPAQLSGGQHPRVNIYLALCID